MITISELVDGAKSEGVLLFGIGRSERTLSLYCTLYFIDKWSIARPQWIGSVSPPFNE